jgi:carbonic anhydrase/acetyltransferase-like protein (isoleucine patch superfamily)
MTLLALGDLVPAVAGDAVVLPGATLVGAVTVGSRASIWYGSVLRADSAPVRVGALSNVQDGCVLHADPGFPAVLGERVTVGHGAVVHGARVDDDCLIGMRATLLNGVHVGAGSVVGAGAVVPEGTEIPPGSLVLGVPGRVRRPVTAAETAMIEHGWTEYARLARRHASTVRPLDGPSGSPT